MKRVIIDLQNPIGFIHPEIYGHFTENIGGVFYDGIWVGCNSDIPNRNGIRKFLVDKLREIKPPVIRWPGGCFAETYDWRDGIGSERPVRISWWSRFDGRYENNKAGTHEFMDFCSQAGAKAYFAANLTSATPIHVRNWMDYCLSPAGTTTLAEERCGNGHKEPFSIPFWGVGNENWGGGGNMSPEYYAHEYRRYAEIMRNTAPEAFLIACGANGADYEWTRSFLEIFSKSDRNMDGLSLHYYCGSAGDPIGFTLGEWYAQLKQAAHMEKIITGHWDIIKELEMEKYSALVVDEWGCWHPEGSGPSRGYNLFEQQSTVRDAVAAALTLNIFNNHCDKVRMANVAQLVNNLHCLFLASGADCIVTPTYYIYDMYKQHQSGTAYSVSISDNGAFEESVSVSASVKNNVCTITIVNLSAEKPAEIMLGTAGDALRALAKAVLLTHSDYHAHNTFESPDMVKPYCIDMDISKAITLPKAGVILISAELKSSGRD